jgi:hypothetical protein
MEGSKYYRIPSLLMTRRGVLLAVAEARISNLNDFPNKINVALRRSVDMGKTWSEIEFIAAYPGEDLEGTGAGNCAMVEDNDTGTIWLFFNYFPSGTGQGISVPGTGFDSEGRKLLFDPGNFYTIGKDGRISNRHSNTPTPWHVEKNGDLFEGNKPAGNIGLVSGKLQELRTTYLRVMKSEDDGLTWSEPEDITAQVKAEWMGGFCLGPGIGIQLTQGKYKGRILLPIYYNHEYSGINSACAIYSDDHCKTWRRGKSPNDGRIINGVKIDSRTIKVNEADLNEAQLLELSDGSVAFYLRNHTGKQRTGISYSKDGGETWGEIRYDETLLDPTCQSSILRVPGNNNIVLWSNPAHEKERINGTLRISTDDGKSWSRSVRICDGQFMYSCLACGNGIVFVLYEGDSDIMLKQFDIETLLEG